MFKKQKLLLLIICLIFILFGCRIVTKSQGENIVTAKDKNSTDKNIKIDTDKKYQNTLEILEKETAENNDGVYFGDPSVPENDRLIANQLYMIVNSELAKPIHLRNYDFILWYVDKYLADENTALKDRYNSYNELTEGVENAFPTLENFNNQADMTNISYIESNFYKLLLEYYEYKYLISLTKEQQKIIEKEHTAWEKYKSTAMAFFTEFHVKDGGSMAGILRGIYSATLSDQYFSTVLGCSFTDNISNNSSSNEKIKLDYTFIDTFPKYLEKVYSNKSTKSAIPYSYRNKDKFERLIILSKAEIEAWNKWIDIRNSYGANGFDSKKCNYEYYTKILKRNKLIDVKNLYNNHVFVDSSLQKVLLKPNSSVEEILNYDFITSYKE